MPVASPEIIGIYEREVAEHGHAGRAAMLAAEAMGCRLGHELGGPCIVCERTMCAQCDFTDGYRVLRTCIDCRYGPECMRCGRPIDRGQPEGWCRGCVREAWDAADEREEAEHQARLARQRARRRANPPEPGPGWARGAAKRIAYYGLDSEVQEFTKAEVVERQGSESCSICEATDDLVLDHVHPLAAGGSHTLDNVRLLCAPCNGWKVAEIDRPLIEARRGELRRAQLCSA